MAPADLLIHWLLELIGGGACTCAVRWCPHRRLRWAIWFTFSVVSTVITVQIVG